MSTPGGRRKASLLAKMGTRVLPRNGSHALGAGRVKNGDQFIQTTS